MFGFNKKKKDEKKHSKLDKLIMGAIVGGAVGSVIGMTIAPQKGKETREMIAQKGKDFIKKGQESFAQQPKKKGFLNKFAGGIFARDKKVKKNVMKDKDMHKIPNEVE